ncbi:MAG: DUF5330 domain-containing protein [Pseudomonadota bacterium]
MKFLIKAAFWLGIVVLFLPLPERMRNKNEASVSTGDAIAFLSSAVSDIKGFCTRNPDSCVTGAIAVHHFGQKAQYGAQILHAFISEKVDDSKDLKVPKGSRAKESVNQTAKADVPHGTLNADDLAPAYRAPKVSLSQL